MAGITRTPRPAAGQEVQSVFRLHNFAINIADAAIGDNEEGWRILLEGSMHINSLDDLVTEVRLTWESIQYEGFIPKKWINKFFDAAKKAGQTKRGTVRDLYFMAVVGAVRGTGIDKIIAHSAEGFRDDVETMRARYKIKTGVKLSSETVTIGRIMAVVPHIVCEIIAEKGQTAVPLSELAGVPQVMQCPSFAAMIPRNHPDRNRLALLHQQYLTGFSKLIKSKTTHDQMVKYQNAAIESDFIPDAIRIEYLVRWGIMQRERNVTPPPGANPPAPAGGQNEGRLI